MVKDLKLAKSFFSILKKNVLTIMILISHVYSLHTKIYGFYFSLESKRWKIPTTIFSIVMVLSKITFIDFGNS
jgi:hypothetical protein